jgi:hypothetical protein
MIAKRKAAPQGPPVNRHGEGLLAGVEHHHGTVRIKGCKLFPDIFRRACERKGCRQCVGTEQPLDFRVGILGQPHIACGVRVNCDRVHCQPLWLWVAVFIVSAIYDNALGLSSTFSQKMHKICAIVARWSGQVNVGPKQHGSARSTKGTGKETGESQGGDKDASLSLIGQLMSTDDNQDKISVVMAYNPLTGRCILLHRNGVIHINNATWRTEDA